MNFLLDVNALVALGFAPHTFHVRVVSWLKSQSTLSRFKPRLATCSIVELGFVRILASAPAYATDVNQACNLLAALKSNSVWPFDFVADGNDATHLPGWAKFPSQTTDGHLVNLAATHGMALATFDAKIPGAHLIP